MARVKLPEIKHLYLLINAKTGEPIPAMDDPCGGENYLCALTLKDAKAACKHQERYYDVNAIPMKIM